MSDTTIKALEAATGGTDLGAIQVMQSATPVKISKTTVVDQTGAEVPFALNATVAAITTSLGTDGTSPPSIAGTGVRGWLRAIYDRLVAGIGRTWSLSSGTDSVTIVPSGTQSVSGTITANAGSGSFTVAQATAANLNATVTGSVAASQSGTWNIGNITGTVSLPTGAATAAAQTNVQSAAGTSSATVLNVQGNAGGVALPVSGTLAVSNFPATQAVSGTLTVTQGNAGAQAWPVTGPLTDTQLRASAVPVSVGNFPATQAVNLSQVNGAAISGANPVATFPKPNELGVTAVGAAAAAVTVTLPAVAGQFHYIDAIEITCYASAAGTGGATPVTVTSTNIPGNPAWTFPSARAIGTNASYVLTPNRPVRSVTANTATTIVCPATTGVIWRVNVFYTAAP